MITEVQWSDEAERRMSHEVGSGCLPFLKLEVLQGIAQLWHCKDEEHEAYCVTRLDHNPTEWVICYFEGSGLVKFGAHFVAVAKRKGLPLRAHTPRASIVRVLQRKLGFAHAEHVLRVTP